MSLERELDALASATMQSALGLEEVPSAILRKAQDSKFGDYQINGCMGLAKKLGKSPRDLAGPVAEAMLATDAVSEASVAGPGFVNLRLEPTWLAKRVVADLADERLGVEVVETPETIVIDYSSPNIAKQMHVGHLRSTIIGDSLARLFRFTGHKVIADNHLGDWGTQYGLLIVGEREFGDADKLKENPLAELERVYKLASAKAKEDEAFANNARAELAKLQAGDEANLAAWKRLVDTTRVTLDKMYERLDIHFDEWLGESAYHDMLPGVVQRLLDEELAVIDKGAVCIFIKDLPDPKGLIPKKLKKAEAPYIVRKSDGAFMYATTDIATALYRKSEFDADRSVYVVDERQNLHFTQLFTVSAFLGIELEFDFVGFGTILGKDGKPLSTRSGGTLRLETLLDEAEEQALKKISELREAGRLRIADEDVAQATHVIGVGAVKYADLMQNRSTDYKFDFDKMIAFSGNAGPYLQYQYARCRSIFAKGEVDFDGFSSDAIAIVHPKERALAFELARFGDVVHRAAKERLPHYISDHLFAIAQAFSGFYTDCPVLGDDAALQASRLALTKLTALQLRKGLDLMGIGVLERM